MPKLEISLIPALKIFLLNLPMLKKSYKEIRANMISGIQMNRLLQGDVGSGKPMLPFMFTYSS